MEIWFTTDAWVSLVTLTALEVVLGIDNIVFISILAGRLPPEQRDKARRIGLGFALIARLVLLASISWVMTLTEPLFTVAATEISGRSLILLVGGIFLLGKSTHEIYVSVEQPGAHQPKEGGGQVTMGSMLIQIALLDIVFSLDSVITAVGMASEFQVMAAAMIIAVVVMLVFANDIGDFVDAHPSMKVLALAFLILVAVMLVAEGFGQHVSKGYIYSAMTFSLAVELLNLRRAKRKPPAHRATAP